MTNLESTTSSIDKQLNQRESDSKKRFKTFPETITNDLINAKTLCTSQKIAFNFNRFVLIVFATIYVSLIGSIVYGWPGFSNMLFRDGVYGWLCPEGAHIDDKRYDCERQDTAVQRLFQITMPCQYIMSMVAGTFIDNFGPKFTASLGQMINFSAWLLLSFSSEDFDVYVLCFVLIGMGADTGFLPTLQLSNIFPGYNGLIIALLGAANSASFAIPTIMDAIQVATNSSFSAICYGYMIIIFMMFIFAITCLPRKSYNPLEYYINQVGNISLNNLNSNAQEANSNPGHSTLSSQPITSNKNSSLYQLWLDLKGVPRNLMESKDQILTSRFLAVSFYFCSTSLILNYFIVSGEQLLTTEVNTFYGIINPLSFLPTIVYGKLVDTIGPVKVMAINTSFAFLSYILANIPWIYAKYCATITMTIYVSIYTSQMYFFIKDRFNDLHFGKLVGIASMTGGVVSLLSVYLYDPLTKVTFNSNFLYTSLIMMGLCILNYLSLFFMRGHSRLLEQKIMRNSKSKKIVFSQPTI